MEQKLDRFKCVCREQRSVFFISFAAGLFAFGFFMTNVLNNHDSVYYLPSGFGFGVSSGRWFLELLGRFVENWWGGNYVLPLYNGLFALFYMAAACCVIVSLLRIRSQKLAVLLSCLFMVFPCLGGIFPYIFTVQYYAFAILLAVTGVWLTDRRTWGFLPGALCLTLSMGIYQAYLPLAASLLLLCLLRRCFLCEDGAVRELVFAALRALAMLVLSLILYFAATRLFLRLFDQELTAYSGIAQMGRLPLADIPGLLLQAYKDILLMPLFPVYGVAMSKVTRLAYLLSELLSAFLFLSLLFRAKLRPVLKLGACLFMLLLPVAMDLIIFMCRANIYELMTYALVCIYYLPAVLLELAGSEKISAFISPPRFVSLLLSGTLFLASLNYAWQDNINSMTLFYSNQQTVQYFSSMVTRIRSVDGYAQDKKLAIIGEMVSDNSFFNAVGANTGAQFHGNFPQYINIYSWFDWIHCYLGWNQPAVSGEELQALTESETVRDMPCYPDSGSIRLVDGVLVLKLEDLD